MNQVFKPIFTLVFCFFCAALAIAQQDTSIYKTIGGTMEDRFKSVVNTEDSDLIFAGMTSSIDGFNQWGLVAKTDELLNIEWTKVYGDGGNASFNNIILTESGFLCVGFNLTAANSYDGLVVNFSSDGEVIWDRTFGGPDWDFFNDSHMVSDGYVICGETYNETAGGTDGWLLKIDFDGNLLWEKSIGTEHDEVFNSIDEFVSGSLALGGEMENDVIQQMWILKTDANGDFIHENFFGDINEHENGVNAILTDFINENYYYGGYMYNSDNDSEEAVSGALDFDGNIIWVDTVFASGPQSWNGLEFGGSNVLTLSGTTKDAGFGLDQNDFFIKRMTREQGTFVFQAVEGTFGNDECYSGIECGNGYVYTGFSDGQGNGQEDGFIVKIGPSGSSENAGISECEIESNDQLVNISEVESETFKILDGYLVLHLPIQVSVFDYSGRLLQKFHGTNSINLDSYNQIIVIRIGNTESLVYRPALLK